MKKAGDAISPEYRDWRNRFLWQRLHLWFWLALMCLLTFTIRDIYDLFFPFKDLAVPKELRNQGFVIHAVMFCSILTCLAIHKTKFGRRRPGLLFLGLSWSITLVEQIFGTINGFALPNIIAWSLVFLSQATFMPVRWTLHLTSQLVVLAYFFGVNTALGLKFPVSGKPIYDVTFILFLFWFCFICDFGVYLYDRLQRSEFYARRELETAYQKLEAAEAGLIEDITKRKLAEAALQEQFDFLHVLINTIPAPVFYKNAQGLFVGCNLVFEESFAVSKEQIIGKTVYDLAPKELADQYHQADMALFERRGVQTYESSVVYKDGKKHDVIFYKATFSKADGTLGGLVGVILDISDRKRTEEALRVFFHAVSHDLRNPVLGTLMVLRNLLSTGGSGGILVPRSILERMEQSSDRQLNLINSLLEAHISEMQGVVLQRQVVQLHAVVEAAITDLKQMLVENQITLTNLVSAELPSVNADGTQLWRVFSNLIVNAIKHNPPGLSITINATVENDKIYCTVADNGVGISTQQSEHLFDLYFRGGNVRNSISLGLGLYLCKQIITAHGGEIGVKSAPGEGATFWFTLPL